MRAPEADTADRRAACAQMSVSRETLARLALYEDRLRAWQHVKNLVAPSTLDTIWTRHIADSAQLVALMPHARRWVDLGSGAGFPGLVIAILMAGQDGAHVDLVESNARKCAFLREVVRDTAAPATVHAGRIETVLPRLATPDVVTSRALAPLPILIDMSRSLLDCGAVGLFLTGEHAGDSFEGSAEADDGIEALPSRTRLGARIMRVTTAAAGVSSPDHRSRPAASGMS